MSETSDHRIARIAAAAPARKGSAYPEPFASRVAARTKQPLGDLFGLRNFGVNLVTLHPGGQSALRHRHTVQDEFVYVLSGEVVLVHDEGEEVLRAGMCIGFPAEGAAHHFLNRSPADATYLEVGDRLPGDSGLYPDDDLQAVRTQGGWQFRHKNGEPYP